MTEPAEASNTPDLSTALAVADYLKARIRSGYLAPGQRLVEADLIRDTQASRGRVREALHRLVVEGIVEVQEFRGASVKRLTRAEVDQNYRAREVLESLCARLVAERGSDALLARIAALQEEMDACEAEGDHDRYGALNETWHELIIEGSGNAYAQSFLERLRIPIFRIQFRRMFSRRALVASNARHRAVTAAMVARQADICEREMRRHIRDALEDLANTGDEHFGP